MNNSCTIQLFADGVWHDVGSVSLLGDQAQGWRSKTYTGYAVDWAIEHVGARDAHAFACRFPVGLQDFEQPHWPVFLIDMLPQGFGREELLRRLGLSPMARRIRWEGNDGGAPDWSGVIDKVCEIAQPLVSEKRTPTAQRKALREVSRPILAEGLRLMTEPLQTIAAHGTDFGLEPAVHTHLKRAIAAQAQQLAALH